MDLKLLGLITGFILFIYATVRFIDYKIDRRKKKLLELKTEDLSYAEVQSEYEHATPIQKIKFKSKYKGVKVKWQVEFQGIGKTYKLRKGTMMMSFYNSELFQYVNFKLKYDKFPLLKSAAVGDKFIVTGLIEKVRGNTIYLKLIDIKKNEFFVF